MTEQGDVNAARAAAFRLLARRAHGEAELYAKLCRKHDAAASAAAMAELKELNLLDDAVFAEDKAESLARRGKSRREIRARLLALGIGREVAEEALCRLEADDDETALAVVRKSYMEKLRAGQREKVVAALGRRGFGQRDILAALQAVEEEL